MLLQVNYIQFKSRMWVSSLPLTLTDRPVCIVVVVLCGCCYLMCICCTVCALLFLFFTLDDGLLYSEGPATGHLDTGFGFPVSKSKC